MRNYIQKGDAPDVVFLTVAKAGDAVLIGDALFGVVPNDQAAGTSGPLATVGMFDLPKAAGEIAPGKKLFWDAAAGVLTTAGSGKPYVATAPRGAPAGAATVVARLNGIVI